MDQEIAERFTNVLKKGNQLLVHQSATGNTRVAPQLCLEWQSQSLTLLQAVFGSDHVYARNFETSTTASGFVQTSPANVSRGQGVLSAAVEDLSHGWTRQFREMIHAEVFDDFLEMADHLLNNGGYHIAAIVLTGGTLEEHLRQFSQKHSLPVEDSVAKMNDALWKKGVYPKPTWRHLQGWYDLRTDAAHGKQRSYTNAEVEDMIRGVRNFIVQYPA